MGFPINFKEMYEMPKADGKAIAKGKPLMKVLNGRVAQARAGSPAEFFKEHGFCLLNHKTEVKDWNDDYLKFVSDITNIYWKETEDLLKEQVFTGGEYGDVQQVHKYPVVLRRGKGQKVPVYANGIHQDFGTGTEGLFENLWANGGVKFIVDDVKKKYDDPECKGMITVCFWRPI